MLCSAGGMQPAHLKGRHLRTWARHRSQRGNKIGASFDERAIGADVGQGEDNVQRRQGAAAGTILLATAPVCGGNGACAISWAASGKFEAAWQSERKGNASNIISVSTRAAAAAAAAAAPQPCQRWALAHGRPSCLGRHDVAFSSESARTAPGSVVRRTVTSRRLPLRRC